MIDPNGIAHIQLTVRDVARSRPFYYRLLHETFGMPIQYDAPASCADIVAAPSWGRDASARRPADAGPATCSLSDGISPPPRPRPSPPNPFDTFSQQGSTSRSQAAGASNAATSGSLRLRTSNGSAPASR